MKIVSIACAHLNGVRPRVAGCNARLGSHGKRVEIPVVKIVTDTGASGHCIGRIEPDAAHALIGMDVAGFIDEDGLIRDTSRGIDYALWDLLGKAEGVPVYRLAARKLGMPDPGVLDAPVYDTSLYIDDLAAKSHEEGAAIIAAEAKDGYDAGHRSFKIKVGRGARHMDLEAGTVRDIAVIRAVRDTVGPACEIMLDANNGYNLGLTKRVLAETAGCRILWMEEPFPEDYEYDKPLKDWLAAQNLPILIADGEGWAHPELPRWAAQGAVDVLQYDFMDFMYSGWLRTGREYDKHGIKSAPHHYGAFLGNVVCAHFHELIAGFMAVEWDEAKFDALDISAYKIADGKVRIPELPGFGVELDESEYAAAVKNGGFIAG